ncbi:hypothetical protein [Massilia timonae]|uniref:hypothetical protein n=1 Tax=Massilia timonae TaxID=47229 RepID=UPI00289F7AC5|nr:hypothetical protein [Massilia timonae]
MATYWTEDGSTWPVITANLQRLVEQFNRTVGTLGVEEMKFQADFIANAVSYDEAVSYIRFVEYMLATVELSNRAL